MSESSNSICFKRSHFTFYMYLLLGIIAFTVYVLKEKRIEKFTEIDMTSHLTQNELHKRIEQLQDELYNVKIAEQNCKIELIKCNENKSNNQQIRTIERVYNPTVSPERTYIPSYNETYSAYQMIGYIYKDQERYPLYGRHKYPGRSDRWEYYIIDETRNKLKIPFRSTNDNELYDGDNVNVNTLGNNYSAKIYDYEERRYNPNVL